MSTSTFALSVVVIGKNQGHYLKACFDSIKHMHLDGPIEVIYINTHGCDNSLAIASGAGVATIDIDPPHPCAAVARNVGWKIAQYPFVFFLDADTTVDPFFVRKASGLFTDKTVAAVCGHRREQFPERSIYQRVFDLDWIYPTGEVEFFGGDAIVRKDVLLQAGGYEVSLAVGEEPELCLRIRASGYKIIRLNVPMTKHDLNILTFSQYWRRCQRTGYAYADVSHCFSCYGRQLWAKESSHNLLKGGGMILLMLLLVAVLPWSVFPFLIAVFVGILMVIRTAIAAGSKSSSWKTRLLYGLHSHFQHIPMLCGQLIYFFKGRGASVDYH